MNEYSLAKVQLFIYFRETIESSAVVAKNPCRNNIFFMLKSFDNDAPVI